MTSYLVIGAVLVYFIALTVVSYITGKKMDEQGFIAGGYKIPVLGTFSSLFVSTIDGAGLVFLVSVAAAFGFGLYWLVAGIFLTALVFYTQADRIKRITEEKKLLNITDLLSSQVGKITGVIALIITTILLAAHSASLLYITGQVFSAIFGATLFTGIVVTAIVVGAYIFFGGYKAVIGTDIVQFVAIVLLLGSALFISDMPTLEFAQKTILIDGTFKTIFGIILFASIMFYTVPAIWQRVFTASSTKSARKSLLLFGLSYVPIYFFIIAFGTTLLAMFPGADASTFLYSLSSGTANSFIGVILSVSLLALTMSSLDTQVYIFLSTVVSNWLGINKETNPVKYVRTLKTLIVLAFILMTVVALTISNVVTFVLTAFALLSVLAPALFVSVYTRGGTKVLDYTMAAITLVGAGVFMYMLKGHMFTGFFENTIPALTAIGITFVGWMAVEILDLKRHFVQEA